MLNTAQELIQSFGVGNIDYKAPHAPRGTPMKLRLNRNRAERKKAARAAAMAKYGQPQPIKHMHSAARRRAMAAKASKILAE